MLYSMNLLKVPTFSFGSWYSRMFKSSLNSFCMESSLGKLSRQAVQCENQKSMSKAFVPIKSDKRALSDV